MKLIVGLGNPGIGYRHSRHNIGFLIVNKLAKRYKVSLKKDKITTSLVGKAKIDNQEVLLAKPLTFMNLSGRAVGSLVKGYQISLKDLLVVCDDLDLELGRIKIKAKGSSAGHKGLDSVIDSLGSENFARLRLGIGRGLRKNITEARYVLSPFHKKERIGLQESIEKAVSCSIQWVSGDINKCMNIFNARLK